MKKYFILVILSFASLLSFGQITSKSVLVSNTKNTVIASNRCGKLVLEDGIYVIKFRDALTPQFLEIKLGDKEQAIESLNFLYDFAYNYEKKSFFEMEQDDKDITFYKYAETAFMISYGDIDYCREVYKASLVSGIVGGYYGQNRIDNPMYCWCDRVFIKRCVENINN